MPAGVCGAKSIEGDAATVGPNGDAAFAVSTENRGVAGLKPFQNIGMRVAETVQDPDRNQGKAGLCRVQEGLDGGRSAAVMSHLENHGLPVVG